jgi:Domain of unknown function (DUF892)
MEDDLGLFPLNDARSQRANSGSTSSRAGSPAPTARWCACSARIRRASGSRALLAQIVRALSAARAVCARRTASDQDHPPGGAPTTRIRGAPRTRSRRLPAHHADADRAAARAARPPLPSAQESLPWDSKSRAAGGLDRGSGQSQPDGGCPAGRGLMNRGRRRGGGSDCRNVSGENERINVAARTEFLSGLEQKRDLVCSRDGSHDQPGLGFALPDPASRDSTPWPPSSASTSRKRASTSAWSESACAPTPPGPLAFRTPPCASVASTSAPSSPPNPTPPPSSPASPFAFEHLEIAAYELLRRVAERADDHETSAVAGRILGEERRAGEPIAGTWDPAMDATLAKVASGSAS